MSASKTQNYQLHAWAPGDDFLREEFNENFAGLDQALAALDGKKVEVVFGSYTGNYVGNLATEWQTITLGFTPRAVLIMSENGAMRGNFGGMAIPGVPSIALAVVENGFKVFSCSSSGNNWSANNDGMTYCYIALK